MPVYHQEAFTPEETAVLTRFFTNVDLPVFGLINLPEVVKGALFARYSRSSKSLRRLFLDEFVTDADFGIDSLTALISADAMGSTEHAEQLYHRIFFDYGDDSVAQLGGAHLACEQASNLLTKVLEWGRLAAYLEQSTRYIRYDTPLGGRNRYLVPDEIEHSAHSTAYLRQMERTFEVYTRMVAYMTGVYEERFPRGEDDSKMVWNATIRAKACDTVRGLLPVSTLSNVGIYGTGQAYEMALVRMQASPVLEVRSYGEMMLCELRQIIPSFLTRVDLEDRGVRWSKYLADVRADLESAAADLSPPRDVGPSVTLTDWDPDAETKIAAAALYAVSELPDQELQRLAREMSSEERASLIAAMVGQRANRRHKPGRAMERTTYRFDVSCDIGAFRDLQRHRLMTLEWQRFSTRLGYDLPEDLVDHGLADEWVSVMDDAGDLYETVRSDLGPDIAQYIVPFAYNVRFVMEMSPRQAFHLIELRSQPAGHPAYRAVAHAMHRAIRDVAGHHLIADAMTYVDYTDVDLQRLDGERKAEARKASAMPSTK
ncbi:MAG TPA: FAD-dependent thymidylate synthase [Acidimicrobiia bacterium]|nr:FAD-dependent thymidylate synthase [Acidimicrobiia bacterium]